MIKLRDKLRDQSDKSKEKNRKAAQTRKQKENIEKQNHLKKLKNDFAKQIEWLPDVLNSCAKEGKDSHTIVKRVESEDHDIINDYYKIIRHFCNQAGLQMEMKTRREYEKGYDYECPIEQDHHWIVVFEIKW